MAETDLAESVRQVIQESNLFGRLCGHFEADFPRLALAHLGIEMDVSYGGLATLLEKLIKDLDAPRD